MKYLKPYNEAIKKLNHPLNAVNDDDAKAKKQLKIDLLILNKTIYKMTKKQFDFYFWINTDFYSLALSVANSNYKHKFDIKLLGEKRLKEFYITWRKEIERILY